MKLSERLMTIASCVNRGDIVADIGTDHAYIPIYLVENEISNRIIASDINQGPVDNAIKSIRVHHFEAQIEAIKAPGLKGIKNPIDSIIIAGMGGLLIAEIIKEDIALVRQSKKLILQPMSKSIELRKYLYDNHFKIVEEKIAIEGNKFYEIIIAENGEMIEYEPFECEISKALKENQDANSKKFIKDKIEKLYKIIDSIRANEKSKNEKRLIEMENRLKSLMGVYEDEN